MDMPLGLGDVLEVLPSRPLFFPHLQGRASPIHPDSLEVGGCLYSPTFVLWQWSMTIPGKNLWDQEASEATFTFIQELF